MHRETSQTVQRALDVIDALEAAGSAGLTMVDLARRLQMHKTIVRRLVNTLMDGDYVRRTPPDSYVLGLRLFALGRSVAEGMELRRVALPEMRELSRATGETVLLTVLDGRESVCVEKVDPAAVTLRVASAVGRRMPLFRGASSKVLLAFQPEPFIAALLAELPAEPVDGLDRDTLRRQLEQFREQGYVLTSQELDEGLGGVSAPVRDHTGAAVAGLTVVGPIWRVTAERIPELARAVMAAAAATSREMGMTLEERGAGDDTRG